jgi:hypothetical protein
MGLNPVPTPNCDCAVYEKDAAGKPVYGKDGKPKCAMLQRYKKIPDPPGISPDQSIYVELGTQEPIFSAISPGVPLTIDGLQVLGPVAGDKVKAYLTGTKFLDKKKDDDDKKYDEVFVNGKLADFVMKTPKVYELTFDAGDADDWNVAVFQNDVNDNGQPVKTSAIKTFANPFVLEVGEPEQVDYAPKAEPPVLTVKFAGRGFTGTTRVTATGGGREVPAEFFFTSPREAVVKLTSPTKKMVVTFDNGANKRSRVVSLPPPEEPKSKPKFKVFEEPSGQGGENGSPP